MQHSQKTKISIITSTPVRKCYNYYEVFIHLLIASTVLQAPCVASEKVTSYWW